MTTQQQPHCDLIFSTFADWIMREQGIDVYETKAQLKADNDAFLAAFNQYRHTFTDELQQQVWQEYQRSIGILPPDEQQAKDEFNLQKARTAKAALRAAGTSDAARLGYCKRRGCTHAKTERLLVRGFCPDCRGVVVAQTIPGGGSIVTGTFDATRSQMLTTLTVTYKKPHDDTQQKTTEERTALVLAAKKQHPDASQRDLADLTGVSQKTVSRILKRAAKNNNQTVTTTVTVKQENHEAELAAGETPDTLLFLER